MPKMGVAMAKDGQGAKPYVTTIEALIEKGSV
jgi:hypothetical protein